MLIVFEGDWVRLHLESKWHHVTDIKAGDICVLDDGRKILAEGVEVGGKIAELLSNVEYMHQKLTVFK